MSCVRPSTRGIGPACLIVLFWAFLAPHIARGSLNPEKAITQYIHESWQTDAGLPEGVVQDIAQTPDGYLWFGTEEGLARFDGVRFTHFDHLNTPALGVNQISALTVDHAGRLWIGTRGGGLICYSENSFHSFTPQLHIQNLSILSLFEDEAQRLWIGTESSGLLALKDSQVKVFAKKDGLPNNTIFALTGDHAGNIWVGTGQGLRRIRNNQVFSDESTRSLDADEIRTLLFSSQGEVWIGTGARGVFLNSSSGLRPLLAPAGLLDKAIAAIYEDRAGTLWFGSWQSGLVRYASGRFTRFGEHEGLTGNSAPALFEDREGGLWIGGAGVTHLSESFITPLTSSEGLVSDTILPIFQDSTDAIWVGSDKGLLRLKNNTHKLFNKRSGLPDDGVFSLAETAGNVIWAGTRSGLVQLKGSAPKIYSIRDGLPSASIFCTYTDRHGQLWVGSRGGLSRWDGRRFRTYTTRDGLSNNFVTAIYQDHNDTLWVGTNGGGLNAFQDGHFHLPASIKPLSQASIWAILGDSDGTLWLATNGSGLNRLRNGTLTSFTRENGLVDDVIFQILDDGRGYLWLTSNKGVSKVSRADLESCARHRSLSVNARLYGNRDGMKTHECNGGFQPAGWRMKDGRIWIPTMQGVSIVNPAEEKPPKPPVAVIERVLAGSSTLPSDRPASIPPGQRKLTVQFTAPVFSKPGAVQFRYMLTGFDKEWIQAGTQRQAIYSNLPPREYSFSVQACIDGQCGPPRSTNLFTFRPAFYETNLFYALCSIAVGGVIFAFHRVRIRHLKASENRLLQLVEQRTHELRESRDQLEVRVEERTRELSQSNMALEFEILVRREAELKAEAASRAKTVFLTNMSHELRTPINGIIGMTDIALASNLDVEQAEYLEIIKTSSDILLEVISDILDFSTIETGKQALQQRPFCLLEAISRITPKFESKAQEQGLEFEVNVSADVPNHVIGDEAKLGQVLSNLLANAVKFTKVGSVTTAVWLQSSSDSELIVQFDIRDTGIGIPAEKREVIFEPFSQADYSSTRQYGGTGLGLAITRRLVTMMAGQMWLESEEGLGSTFSFTASFIPIQSNDNFCVVPQLSDCGQPV